MNQNEIIKISEHKELIDTAAKWFSQKWSVPFEAYVESMKEAVSCNGNVPEWYVILDGNNVIAGMGVIENDFHNRIDLHPNVCAVYTEEKYRKQGLAGRLLDFTCKDMQDKGINTLYLLTNHIGFYERYDWEYFCEVLSDGEEKPSRMYLHKVAKPVITTERLYLRKLNYNDFDALYMVLADSDIMCHYPYTFDETMVRNWITKNITRYNELGFGLWAVCLKDTDEMIGDCGLTIQNINGKFCSEIGYHIRADFQRKGYAKEAAAAVKNWAFENTSFKIVYSYMKSDNISSIKTALAYGCQILDEYVDEDGNNITICGIKKSMD